MTPAGSTSPVSPGTRSTGTTPTRPTCGPPVRPCPGRSAATRSTTPPTTCSPSSRPPQPTEAGRRGGVQHRAVLRLHGAVEPDLLVVQQDAGQGADRLPAQDPVVGPAP